MLILIFAADYKPEQGNLSDNKKRRFRRKAGMKNACHPWTLDYGIHAGMTACATGL